jgi:prepilin-type N-terminal cleavage/methylation domain-containing protein
VNNIQKQKNNQLGLTIIELIIAMAIVGIIGTSVVTLISLLYISSGSTSDSVTVQNQVGNAATWIIVDAQMAQHVEIDNTLYPGSLVTFEWVVWKDDDNIKNEVTYLINEANELERICTLTHSYTGDVEQGTTTIAQYLDTEETDCVYDSSSHLITFNIAASKTYYRSVNATSIVKVIPRASL